MSLSHRIHLRYATWMVFLKAEKAEKPKRYECPAQSCTRSFANEGARAAHLKHNPMHVPRKTKAKRHQCEACQQTFVDQMALSLHVVTHSVPPAQESRAEVAADNVHVGAN